MVVWGGCHLPPYPCARFPFNSNHTQWPLEKTQCLLDLRRILTPHPRNHPIPVLRGDPIRTNLTGAAYLAGQFFCLIRRPRRALRRSSQAPRAPGRPPSEWPPASRKYSRQILQARVATHRNAKTVGCRRDCDAPYTLPRLKLCPGLSAESERTPGPFRRSAQPDPAEPAEPSQPRKVGHSTARAAGGAAAPAGAAARAAGGVSD